MKKWIIITISLCFCILSCENDGNENAYCIKAIKNAPGTTILSKSEMDVVKKIFNRNQLDYTKYLFTQFQEDELGHHHIRCEQFANKLIVFTSEAIFHFDKDDNYYAPPDLINTINLNTKSLMKQDNVVEIFIDKIKQYGLNIDNAEIANSCFDIEFGYYDLNAGISYADKEFIKVWKINPTNNKYPLAYVIDENSEIMFYDNGIRY